MPVPTPPSSAADGEGVRCRCVGPRHRLRVGHAVGRRQDVQGRGLHQHRRFTGEVFEGKVQTKPSEVIQVLISKTMKPEESEVYGRFAELMMWVNKYRKLRIRTNADQPNQATEAVAFGAEGIGLCRTEHMFFDHIGEFREMILATDLPSREKALAKLLPFQRDDFLGLFKAMGSRPCTIRLLDPPLHEFLPHDHAQQLMLAERTGVSVEEIKRPRA